MMNREFKNYKRGKGTGHLGFGGAALMIGIIFFTSFLLNDPACAWFSEPHKAITRNAVSVLPEPLRDALNKNMDMLLYGSVEPDQNRAHDHKLYISGLNGPPPGSGSAASALEKFAKKAEGMIKRKEPMEKIAFVLGQAAHFIQDVNEPLHTISGETIVQHLAYERVAFYAYWPEGQYGYAGFYLAKKYKCFAWEAAKRSNQYFEQSLNDFPPQEVIEKPGTTR